MKNDYIVIGDTAFVKTKNKCIFMIDKDDLSKIELPDNSYWIQNVDGYICCTKPYSLLHRTIMDAPKDLVVDHINFIKTDNRRVNLRNITRSENSKHKPKYMKKKTKTKFKTVQSSFPKGLLERVDAFKEEKGFGTRTQAIFHLLQVALEKSNK